MQTPENPSPSDNKLTHYVAEFVCGAKVEDLPSNVVALGKKSILDGLGLALSGAVAKSGEYVRQHLADLNLGDGPATVIGSRTVVPDGCAWSTSIASPTTSSGTVSVSWAAPAVTGTVTAEAVLPSQVAVSVVFAGLPSDVRSRLDTS